MKEKDFRNEVMELANEITKVTSLPNSIFPNPLDSSIVNPDFWKYPVITQIKKVWNQYKEGNYSYDSFIAFLSVHIAELDNTYGKFLAFIFFSKYAKPTKKIYNFLEAFCVNRKIGKSPYNSLCAIIIESFIDICIWTTGEIFGKNKAAKLENDVENYFLKTFYPDTKEFVKDF